MARLMLKNPYFEEEIKVKETRKHIADMLTWLDTGNIQWLQLRQIEPTETLITIHPKNFAKIEIYDDADE